MPSVANMTIAVSTNLTPANCLIACTLLRTFEKLLRHRADATSAQTIPHNDKCDGNGKNQRGDCVDFGSNAAPQASPDFERQRVIAPDEEKGHSNFVHGKSEDEEAGGDERELQIGKSDPPKRLPRSGAEIKGSFFLGAIQFLQTGKEFCGGDRNE